MLLKLIYWLPSLSYNRIIVMTIRGARFRKTHNSIQFQLLGSWFDSCSRLLARAHTHFLLAHTKDYCLSKNRHCAIYRIGKLLSGKPIKLAPLQNGKYEAILCPVWINFESVERESRFFCESFFCTPLNEYNNMNALFLTPQLSKIFKLLKIYT